MKVKLFTDELYPVFYLSVTFGDDIDISEEVAKEIKEGMETFARVQDKLRIIYREQVEKR